MPHPLAEFCQTQNTALTLRDQTKNNFVTKLLLIKFPKIFSGKIIGSFASKFDRN